MDPEVLLEHADFVRCLARTLVFDENSARDIAQQTWLTALENPPDPRKPARSWLALVLRNFARRAHRGDVRRKRRERAAASPESIPSAARIAEREEARRQMIDAVLRLTEPLQTAILLRYYEDLPPRAIARRLDLPLGTVKTRLKRGLRQLRQSLDATHGGDRKAWCLGLALVAGLTPGAQAAGSAGTIAGILKGGLVMSSKVKAGAVAALLLGTTFTLWHLIPVGTGDDAARTPDRAIGAVGNIPDRPPLAADRDARTESARSSEPRSGQERARVPVDPTRLTFSGRVVDAVTGDPVPAAFFYMVGPNRAGHTYTAINETMRGDDGRFCFSLNRGGTFLLNVYTARHLKKTFVDLEIPDKKGLVDFEIAMDPGLSVAGRVKQKARDLPVEGAIVGVRACGYSTGNATPHTDLQMLFDGRDASCVHTVTDGTGSFLLSGLNSMRQKIVAVHPDFCEGWVEHTPGDGQEVEIVLETGAHIFGKVYDDRGEPLEGVTIGIGGTAMPLSRYVESGPGGAYRTPPLKPARWWLDAQSTRASRSAGAGFTHERRRVDLEGSDLEVDFGPSPSEYVTWQGTLYDLEHNPAPGGRVTVSHTGPDRSEARSFMGFRSADCDRNGRFEFLKLTPGEYKVQLRFSPPSLGMRFFDFGTVRFDSAGLAERDIRIEGGTIAGRVARDAHISAGRVNAWLVSVNSRKVFGTTFERDGSFRLNGVPPGIYDVTASSFDYALDSNTQRVELSRSGIVNNVRLAFPPAGTLELTLTGYAETGWRDVELILTRRGAADSPARFTLALPLTGTLARSFNLEQGEWTATLSAKEEGMIDRAFVIGPGAVSVLAIDASALEFPEKTITVQGLLTRFDCSPLAGVSVDFFPFNVPAMRGPRSAQTIKADTDADGRFSKKGFLPGTWAVRMNLPDNVFTELARMTIPADPSDPMTVNLVLPAGSVCGTLTNSRTGLRLDSPDTRWSVRILDSVGKHRVGSQHGTGGGRFDVAALRAGDYMLEVDVRGYKTFFSRPFPLGPAQRVDLGDLNLEACGCLLLVAVDGQGEPVPAYTVLCNGERFGSPATGPHSHRCYMDELPTGPAAITVRKKGFRDLEFAVDLEPAELVERRIVLERE